MLPIAALIVTDDSGAHFSGVDLNERAALVAHHAGIAHAYFVGRGQPGLASMRRLHARGLFASGLPGWPRLFAGLPAVRVLVVLDARTVVEPGALKAAIEDASTAPQQAALVVHLGPERKNSLIRVIDGRVVSVLGDGNAMSTGIAVIPGDLLPRIRGVRSMLDAMHRLSKAGKIRALNAEPYFCVPLPRNARIAAIERSYYRHITRAAISEFASRLLRWSNPLRVPIGEDVTSIR
jgi:uncharacterized C2H2 Zn-finger protein